MTNQKEIKKKKQKTSPPYLLWVSAVLLITLIFGIITAFFCGRAVAHGKSEDMKRNLYLSLSDSPFAFVIPAMFGDNIPVTDAAFPDCVNSDASSVRVDFNATDGTLKAIPGEDHYESKIFAVDNPRRLILAKSTQGSNRPAGILALSGGTLAFSASDSESDTPLVLDGEKTGTFDEEFFGITEEGILLFGKYSELGEEAEKLAYAASAEIHALIVDSSPTEFSPCEIRIGRSSVAIGQCEDGSLIVGIFGKDASVSDISKIFYKYKAVNAAIVYVGDYAGVSEKDGSEAALGKAYSGATYSSAWIIR